MGAETIELQQKNTPVATHLWKYFNYVLRNKIFVFFLEIPSPLLRSWPIIVPFVPDNRAPGSIVDYDLVIWNVSRNATRQTDNRFQWTEPVRSWGMFSRWPEHTRDPSRSETEQFVAFENDLFVMVLLRNTQNDFCWWQFCYKKNALLPTLAYTYNIYISNDDSFEKFHCPRNEMKRQNVCADYYFAIYASGQRGNVYI